MSDDDKILPLNEIISYETASTYIRRLEENEFLASKTEYLGATMNAARVRKWSKHPKFSGLMIWFCIIEKGENTKVKIALEPRFNFTYPKEETDKELAKIRPMANKLLFPRHYFGHGVFDDGITEDRLKNHRDLRMQSDLMVKRQKVIKWFRNFKDSPDFGGFRKTGFAYFCAQDPDDPKNKELRYFDEFFKLSDVGFIRFYFGYDEKCKPNGLRPILVPVDYSGKNISLSSFTLRGDVILQKSWPPKRGQTS